MTSGTLHQTPVPVIGCGRSLGYALALDWPAQVASRLVLGCLVPERFTATTKTKPADTVRGWLRRAEKMGRIQRGVHLVKILDPQGLLGEATNGLDDYRAADLIDIGQAVRWASPQICGLPSVLAARVAGELEWLSELDLSALPSAR